MTINNRGEIDFRGDAFYEFNTHIMKWDLGGQVPIIIKA
jgi:hypothetical protein